jgi:hypothetical protein
MALIVADRVQETTLTVGTIDYVLVGAKTGFQSFGSVMANADTTYYTVTDGTDWEVGIGTYSTTGPTMARTTILSSSNAGAAVNWSAGTKDIFLTYAAERSVYLNANGDLAVDGTTLYVDAANNRVGVGTSSPSYALDVQGATDPSIRVRATGTTSSDDSLIRMSIAGTTANNIIQFGDLNDIDAGYISYDHASDYLAVGVNAAERMRIDASGNVGIGTSSPLAELHVNSGAANLVGLFESTDAGATITLIDDATTGGSVAEHGLNTVGNELEIRAVSTLAFETAATQRMTITSTGNVGIGTSSPTADLSVGSTTTSSGDVHLRTTKTTFEVTPSNSDGGGADINVGFVAGGQGPLKFSIGGAERARIDSSGNLLVGGTSGSDRLYVENSLPTAYSASNTLTAPPLTWFYNTNATAGVAGTIRLDGGTSGGNAATTISAVHTGSGSSALTFGTRLSGSNVTERVRIDASGSVGIGTTTPGQLLEVSGTARVTSFGVGTNASGTTGEIRATNNITAYYSDDRLKTRIGVIDDPIGKVMSLSGFYYEANETAQALGYEVKQEVGVSAQEVQAVMPEVVAPAPIDEQYLTVRYERLVPLLIEAIKAQQVQIDELRAKLGV